MDRDLERPPYAMESGTREGLDAWSRSGMDSHDLFDYDAIEVRELAEGPEGVLVMVRYRGSGKTSGAPVDVPMAHVLQIRDGRVARLAWYGTRAEGADAAGL